MVAWSMSIWGFVEKAYALGAIEGYTKGQDNCFINELDPELGGGIIA